MTQTHYSINMEKKTLERYHWNNEGSSAILNNGYVLPGTTVQDLVHRIADTAATRHKDKFDYDDVYTGIKDAIEYGFLSLSSPIWANFGVPTETRKGLPISCFGTRVEDSVPGIIQAWAESSMEGSLGGGTSTYWGDVRARGSEINGGSKSDGSFSFLPMFEGMVKTISQGGVRRGQMAVYQDVEHPDIKEWLGIYKEGNPIQTMVYGVCIGDEWMESMLGDKENGIPGDPEKREIWAEILGRREKIGLPFLFWRDNADAGRPEVYKVKEKHIQASNMCVHGDTKILTQQGYKPINTLVDTDVNVWNGQEWSRVIVRQTGENKKLLKVVTSTGQELLCTPEHKFYTQESYSVSSVKEVRAKDLLVGNKLIKFDLPEILDNTTNAWTRWSNLGYANGFFSGDGCQVGEDSRIYLYGDKRKLREQFPKDVVWTEQPEHNRIYGNVGDLWEKFKVPVEYSHKVKLHWLAGLLDSDGTISRSGSSETLQIANTNKEFLLEVQLMLQTLGVESTVRLLREEGVQMLPKNDGSGELGEYPCKVIYRLLIGSTGLHQLVRLGLICHRLQFEGKEPQRSSSEFIRIVSVEEVDGLHDTFCFTEHKRHMGMFNGILTGQCTEIMLPYEEDESFICCLASYNFTLYEYWKDTDLYLYSLLLLDAVLEEFIEKTEHIPHMHKTRNFAINHRSVGIGILGWHSYLQSKNIVFSDLEAILLAADSTRGIKQKLVKASADMIDAGYERPKIFEGTDIKQRHATLMAIAPTKSSSGILGQVSLGIEPYETNYFVKDLAKVKMTYRNPYLTKLLQSKGLDTDEIWMSILNNRGSVQHLTQLSAHEKKVFRTFEEIPQMSILQQASARQSSICQGQSVNVKILPNTSPKEVSNFYIEAWRMKLKSMYYQYNVNAAQALSNTLNSCDACEV